MQNRIRFPGNPWPNGHEIKKLVWTARIAEDQNLWFDLHLESADYYADDDRHDDDEDVCDDWESRVTWSNFRSCTLSSNEWHDDGGFPAGTKESPFDFLATRHHFQVEPIPPPDDFEERAFCIYLLGHDGVADHDIVIEPNDTGCFDLTWNGKIAREYVGDYDFDQQFEARSNELRFSGFHFPRTIDESDALQQIREVTSHCPQLRVEYGDESLRFVPS